MIDTSKVIHAPVGGGRYTVTAPIVKEDYGLYLLIEGLELPSTYEVDFSNSEHNGTSVTMIGNADGVLIPSQFISSGKDIFAFLYHVGVDFGRTVYKFRIPNKLRPDRTDETPTPEEQSTIDQAISALNSAVSATAQDVIDADTSAQSASQSAENAHDSAVDAQNYAESASGYASDAQGYATTASQKATAAGNSADQAAQIKTDIEGYVSIAQGYAQTATDKAAQASQSATNASNSATTASTKAGEASASATTASNKASEASGYATTASNKATEASGYANTASQKASDASDSASAALGYKTDAESAKTAAQTAQGKAEDAQEAAESAAASVSASAAQIATNTADIADLQTDVAQNEADILKAFPTDSASGAIASFSDGADGIPLKSLIVNIDPVQDLSNGDPSPENICPISGWDGTEVTHTGTNLFDGEVVNGRYSNGAFVSSGSYRCSKNYIACSPGMQLFFRDNNNNSFGISVTIFTSTKKFISTALHSNGRFTVPADSNARWLRFHMQASVYASVNGICVSPYDADYEPYNGTTIPINWQTEAGTVYGGKLDVLSGVLVIERVSIELDGSKDEGWAKLDEYNYFVNSAISNAINANTSPDNFMCDSYNYANVINQNTDLGACLIWKTIRVRLADMSITLDDWKAMLANNPIQAVIRLAEPIIVQLEPHEARSLLGENHIWADSGDTEVEYRADTRLYIEKLTQPEEDDMIADSAITSGQFFMIGNSLYRALTNIASGATITVGTNAQRVSLSDALNLVNA